MTSSASKQAEMAKMLRASREVGVRLGQSIAVDLHHCQQSTLASKALVESVMLRAAQESGATVVGQHFHEFSPQGVSGVVVISESHFAVHTWPEFGFVSIDLFTCGPSVDFDKAIRALQEGFGSTQTARVQYLERGKLKAGRAEIDLESEQGEHVMSWREKFEREGARNITAIVDAFDCHAPSGLRPFLLEVTTMLIGAAVEPMLVTDTQATSFSLATAALTISGRLTHDTHRAYISFMSGRFFDPRTIAEVALLHLRGSHYGLQIGMQP